MKSPPESGYIQTRSRYTKNRYFFDVVYRNISDVDHDFLWSFVAMVCGTVATFTWTEPYSGTSYTVRFDSMPTFENVDDNLWNVAFRLTSV